MRHRELGERLRVAAIGLGCLGMAGGYGPADAAACRATIRRALDDGPMLLDTADVYGGGAVEELVGRAVADRRDDAVLATRGGLVCARPGGPPTGVDGRPEHLRQACTQSLRRLGVDHVDLYTLGRVDPDVPVEDSVGGIAELVAAGMVGHVGLSECTAVELRRAHAVHPVTAVQTEYSLWERHVEDAVLPAARELGVALVAHTPLGKGMLAGGLADVTAFDAGDMRARHPRFAGDNLRHNQILTARVARAASAAGTTPARLALAWLLAQGDDVVPIPGTRSAGHLRDNLAAVDVRLDRAAARELAAQLPPGSVRGERVPVRRA